MTLTISFMSKHEKKEVTVMVDSSQKISGTIYVLSEAGIFNVRNVNTIRSVRTKERLQMEKSYKESRIYNGDILVLE